MTSKVGIERDNATLDEAISELADLQERCARVDLNEQSGWANASLPYARQVHDMVVLGRAIAAGARARDECRGSHYKPEFALEIPEGKFPGDPEWDDYVERWKANNERWLRSTVTRFGDDGIDVDFREVDTSVLPPETPRDYR
jgi:succinate dehydrogenase / fumarate reductase flavoprotein subunit